ncbi:MAG: rcc01693 family protein [Pseudomonadota bacterium]
MTDWDGLMRLGLGQLRLSPEVFWAMTPVELDRALEGAGLAPIGGSAPGRGMLDALMARFPDRERTDADG